MSLISNSGAVSVYAFIPKTEAKDKIAEWSKLQTERSFRTKNSARLAIRLVNGEVKHVAIRLSDNGELFATREAAKIKWYESGRFVPLHIKTAGGQDGWVKVNKNSLDRLGIASTELNKSIKRNAVENFVKDVIKKVCKEILSNAVHSFRNKNGERVDLFIDKKKAEFSEDKDLFLKAYPGFGERRIKFFKNGDAWLNQYFGNLQTRIQNNNVLYLQAFIDGKLIGCVSYATKWKQNVPEFKKSLYIEHIFIDPAYAKTGIGRELLFSIFKDETIASHFDSVVALVESGSNAGGFYQKIGFEPVKVSFSVKGALFKWTKNI